MTVTDDAVAARRELPGGAGEAGKPVGVHVEWREPVRAFVIASAEPVEMFDIRDAILGMPAVTHGRR